MITKISNMFFVHWLGIKQQLKCPKTLLFSWPSGETKKNLIFLFLLLFCAKKHDTLGCGNSGKESLAHPINIYEDGVYIRLRCHLCLIASPEMGIWHLRCVKLLNPPISAEQNGSLLLIALQYIYPLVSNKAIFLSELYISSQITTAVVGGCVREQNLW